MKATISVGISEISAKDTSCESVTKRADIALYKTKTTGRNKVIVY